MEMFFFYFQKHCFENSGSFKYCFFQGIYSRFGRDLLNHGFSVTRRNFIVHRAIASMTSSLLENLRSSKKNNLSTLFPKATELFWISPEGRSGMTTDIVSMIAECKSQEKVNLLTTQMVKHLTLNPSIVSSLFLQSWLRSEGVK